ncbi:hypothetical protein J6590_015135 [Homalodisca vitripennis]|nr:hypothetical protein J6590_015135 [Homalodisca vitripennis]
MPVFCGVCNLPCNEDVIECAMFVVSGFFTYSALKKVWKERRHGSESPASSFSTALAKEFLVKVMDEKTQAFRKDSSKLRSEVGEIKYRITMLEQYSRRNNIEIIGIPTTPREDIITVVKASLIETPGSPSIERRGVLSPKKSTQPSKQDIRK